MTWIQKDRLKGCSQSPTNITTGKKRKGSWNHITETNLSRNIFSNHDCRTRKQPPQGNIQTSSSGDLSEKEVESYFVELLIGWKSAYNDGGTKLITKHRLQPRMNQEATETTAPRSIHVPSELEARPDEDVSNDFV